MPEVWIDRRLPDDAQRQTGSGVDVQSRQQKPSYYDVSMLQAPVWEGHYIGPYFFLGGLSGGAYLLARCAELFGGKQYRDVTRIGSTVALLSALPCAPLLIKDLGDPSRFHHMLRVFKPQSPMNVGSWTLTGFGGLAAAAVLREWRRSGRVGPSTTTGRMVDKSLQVILDAAGMPLSLMMTCYTGVLLSGTATPVWSRNHWLAPLFAASAIGNACGAIGLALKLTQEPRWFDRESPAERALSRIDTAAHVAEVVLLVQYLRSLGRLAKPMTAGRQMPVIAGSIGSLVAGEVLKRLPLAGRPGRWAQIAGACLNLASGLALKYGILEAGRSSATDPDAARLASSPARAQPRRLPAPTKFPAFPRPAPGRPPPAARARI